jgi:hypothetical protein
MAAIIQFRRDTASNWTTNDPTLAAGEIGYETDGGGNYKIGNGSTAWTSLGYGGLGDIHRTLIEAKGDLVVGTADDTAGILTAGANGAVLTVDTSTSSGLAWGVADSIVNWHEAVKLATTAALGTATYSNGTAGVGATLTHNPASTPSGYARLTIDGANATTGDRVLIQDQAAGLQNGYYDVTAQGVNGTSAWVLTRAVDLDGSPAGQIKSGESVYVLSGATNSGQGFVVTSTSDPHTVGTHAITFTQFTGTQAFTAGTGLSITGNTINAGTASASRIVVNADDIDLAASGVSAASYGSVTQVGTFTVDTYGRLTAATNATIAIPSTAVTDFTEAVQDVAGAQVATNGSHTGIGATYDDAGDGAIDLTLTASGVSAASYGSATQVPGYTVDTYGRLTAASNTTIAIPSTAVTDFTEAVQDVAGAQVVTNGSHTGLSAAYDDAGDGAIDLSLTNTGVSAASYGSATQVPGYTVDAKGRLTAASNTTIAIPSTAVTDFTEAVQDVSGAQLATNGSHTGITATYDDAGDGAIDLALVTENVQDIVGAQVATNGTHVGLTAAYDDAGDGAVDLTVAATLGTHTSGNYVATVAGTANEVEVTGSGSETAAVTVGLPNDVTIGNDLAVTEDITAKTLALASSATALLTVTSTDTTVTSYGPTLELCRDGTHDDDSPLGHILFTGDDDNAAKQTYGQISVNIEEKGDDAFGDMEFWIGYAGNATIQRNVHIDDYFTSFSHDLRIGDGSTMTQGSGALTNERIYTGYWAELGHDGNDALTADRTFYFPDASGTLITTGNAELLFDGTTAATQSANDNSTKVATTAYVDVGLGALSSDSITDADGDTKIQVEEGSDEDIIRFDTAGTERMSIGATGTVTIVGDLTVNGTTTTVNSTTLTVDDKNIEIGSVASPSDTTADGGGITLKGATDKTWNWVNSTDAWTSSEHIALATGKSVYIDGVLQLSKNALAATVVLADGVAATTQSANDSTTKVATTAFVMTEIGDYAPLASPTLTGVPAAPTAAADTNTTQIATTAYVQTELGALSSDSISDADNDTKIQVEESSDEDKIRFDTGGTERAVLDSTGLDLSGNVLFNSELKEVNESSGTTYTFLLADRGKILRVGDETNNNSAQTITIPTNTAVPYPVGTQIQVVQMGSGLVTMATAGTPTLRYSPGLKLRAQYSSVTCLKIATDEWLLVGDLDD